MLDISFWNNIYFNNMHLYTSKKNTNGQYKHNVYWNFNGIVHVMLVPKTMLIMERQINRNTTRIEPVGEPYREVCLSPWKGNWRISKNRIDWRNVLLSEKNYFHEKELKENGNMT